MSNPNILRAYVCRCMCLCARMMVCETQCVCVSCVCVLCRTDNRVKMCVVQFIYLSCQKILAFPSNEPHRYTDTQIHTHARTLLYPLHCSKLNWMIRGYNRDWQTFDTKSTQLFDRDAINDNLLTSVRSVRLDARELAKRFDGMLVHCVDSKLFVFFFRLNSFGRVKLLGPIEGINRQSSHKNAFL